LNQDVNNLFGIDYNTGLTEIMGANHRRAEVDKLIDSVVILRKFNNNTQADKIIDKLHDLIGEKNDYIEDEIKKRVKQNI